MQISKILNRINDGSKQRSRSTSISSKCSVTCFNCFPSSSSSSSSEISIGAGLKSEQILQNVNAFTFGELELATNGFHSSLKIGEGGCGSVYKGRLQEGRTVAIKVLSADSNQGQRDFMPEIASMADISHENLVKLHGGCVDGPFRILVYDWMENGNLAETLLGGKNGRSKFCWKTRREISLGIARALAYIHEEIKLHIVHRDIKASNVLLDQNFVPKISDFGLSKLFPKDVSYISTRVAGTLGYLAPEYAASGHLTRKTDVYSFGVLLLEIVSGRKAVDFDLQLGEHHLVEKAWEMYKDGKLLQLVDPMLKGDFLEAEAIRYLKISLLCVQEQCGLRPNMSIALKMMRDEIKIHKKEIAQPGLITDFREVKIGRRRKQSSRSITCRCSPATFAPFLT